jgi:hypothetical protein
MNLATVTKKGDLGNDTEIRIDYRDGTVNYITISTIEKGSRLKKSIYINDLKELIEFSMKLDNIVNELVAEKSRQGILEK